MRARLPADRVPIIVGVGEAIDRPADPADGKEPLALMVQALRAADEDAGSGWLQRLDSLDVVNQITWPYERLAGRVAEAVGAAPKRAVYGVVGGESPVRDLHQAALRIVAGESEVAAVCGAEAQHTLSKARQAGIELPWTARAERAENPLRGADFLNPLALAYGAVQPVQVYPLYEMAAQAAWGQTPREGRAESAALWAPMSEVAAKNPFGWSRRAFTPDEIAEPSPENRLIAWLYTKRMVANPTVNQGAAVIVTSLAAARAAGVPDHRLVYVWGGAWANEPRDYLARDQYQRSDAQALVLEAALRLASGRFDKLELYSCFPVVPKLARRTLGLGPEVEATVTGGLSFFGAPLNDYMGHAAAAMVTSLRKSPGVGLLYGQGEYVTKHHAVVIATRPPEQDVASLDLQAEADARRGPVPALDQEHEGEAVVETGTVVYGRDGEAAYGVVIARTPEGGRLIAQVAGEGEESLSALTDLDRSPVGLRGRTVKTREGLLRWRT